MLELHDIHTYYGSSHILHGISLTVNPGEVVCLLGRNGAGKTTTLKSIIGLAPIKKGRIKFKGKDISSQKDYKIARLGVGYVPEDRRVFPNLNVLENLEMGLKGSRQSKWTVERVFEIFPNLAELKRSKGMNLSGGEQQMLTIARTLMGEPELILIDEPSEGLAPVIVQKLGRFIQAIKNDVTILLVEQNVNFAMRLSNRGYIIEKGRVRYEGSAADIKSNEEIRTKYLAV